MQSVPGTSGGREVGLGQGTLSVLMIDEALPWEWAFE